MSNRWKDEFDIHALMRELTDEQIKELLEWLKAKKNET